MNVDKHDAQKLVDAIAEELKQKPEFETPEWAKFVKTGVAKERPPLQEDWWQMRLASIVRKVAVIGPVGVNKLRRKYGGKYRRGYKPAKFAKGSGKIIRVALQQLEKAGIIKQAVVDGHKGRVLDTAGVKLIAKVAKTLKVEAKVEAPEVEKKETSKPKVDKKEANAKVEKLNDKKEAQNGEQ